MFWYEIRTAFMVLLLAQNIIANSSSLQQNHTSVTEQPNSSVAPAKIGIETNNHGSKLLQSVPLIAHHAQQQQLLAREAAAENFTNMVRLEDVLVIFDLNEIAANWPKIRHDLRSNCQHDMQAYLRGLQQHKMWAIKSKLKLLIFLLRLIFAVLVSVCLYEWYFLLPILCLRSKKKQQQNYKKK